MLCYVFLCLRPPTLNELLILIPNGITYSRVFSQVVITLNLTIQDIWHIICLQQIISSVRSKAGRGGALCTVIMTKVRARKWRYGRFLPHTGRPVAASPIRKSQPHLCAVSAQGPRLLPPSVLLVVLVSLGFSSPSGVGTIQKQRTRTSIVQQMP